MTNRERGAEEILFQKDAQRDWTRTDIIRSLLFRHGQQV